MTILTTWRPCLAANNTASTLVGSFFTAYALDLPSPTIAQRDITFTVRTRALMSPRDIYLPLSPTVLL